MEIFDLIYKLQLYLGSNTETVNSTLSTHM